MPKRPEDNRYYNPHNPNHQRVVDTVKEYMERNQKADEADIAEDIIPILQDAGIDMSPTYIRNILSEAREELEEDGILKVKQDPRGGNPATVYHSQVYDS